MGVLPQVNGTIIFLITNINKSLEVLSLESNVVLCKPFLEVSCAKLTFFCSVEELERFNQVEVLVAEEQLPKRLDVSVLLQNHLDHPQKHELFALLLLLLLLSSFLFFPQTCLLSFNLCIKFRTSLGCLCLSIFTSFLLF